MKMDFAAWSPSHLLVAIITLLTIIIGQAIALFTYLKTTAKQHNLEIQKLAEQIQRQGEWLEDRFDKRISEVNQQISEVHSEMNRRLSEVNSEISKLNQNHIDHLTRHQGDLDVVISYYTQ